MRLWTIIDQKQWNELQNNGQLIARPDIYNDLFHEAGFRDAYEWLAQNMQDRGLERPANVQYPIWAWHTHNGKRQPLDLRYFRHQVTTEKHYRLEIKIPDDQLLLSDFSLWHNVLNNWYLAWSEEESDIMDTKYPEGIPKNLVEDSWQGIFDLGRTRDANWLGAKQPEDIQATFWLLKPSNIITATEFFGSRTKGT